MIDALVKRASMPAANDETAPLLGVTSDKKTFTTTPLVEACASNNIQMVDIVCQKFPDSINTPDSNGFTPLMVACVKCNGDMVRLLLAKGAEQTIDPNASSPLHIAISDNSEDIVTLVLDNIGNSDVINAENRFGETPLMCAVTWPTSTLATALIDRGATVTQKALDRAQSTSFATHRDGQNVIETMRNQLQSERPA